MKTCRKCGVEKPLDDFYYVQTRDRYQSNCKVCHLENCRARWLEKFCLDPDKARERTQLRTEGKKRCVDCDFVFDQTEFYRASTNACKVCTYFRRIRASYGLEKAEFIEMYRRQGGLCAICHQDSPDIYLLAVDHCHETGVVRGLLCTQCNQGIGKFYHDADRLLAAAEYLVGVRT